MLEGLEFVVTLVCGLGLVYCLLLVLSTLAFWFVRVENLLAQDYLAKQYPEYWYFGIGTLLIAVVLFAPGGILGLMDKWLPFFKQKSSARASAR